MSQASVEQNTVHCPQQSTLGWMVASLWGPNWIWSPWSIGFLFPARSFCLYLPVAHTTSHCHCSVIFLQAQHNTTHKYSIHSILGRAYIYGIPQNLCRKFMLIIARKSGQEVAPPYYPVTTSTGYLYLFGYQTKCLIIYLYCWLRYIHTMRVYHITKQHTHTEKRYVWTRVHHTACMRERWPRTVDESGDYIVDCVADIEE